MKNKKLSNEQVMAISLLNNISELVTKSNDRTAAKDVSKALLVFLKNKKLNVIERKLENLQGVMLDSHATTIRALVQDMIRDVASHRV